MSSVNQILVVYVLPISAFSLIYNLPKFFELRVSYSECNSDEVVAMGQGYDSNLEEYLYETEDCKNNERVEIVVRNCSMTIFLKSAESCF